MKKISLFLFLVILGLYIYGEDLSVIEDNLLNASDEQKIGLLLKLIEEYNDIDVSIAEKYSNQIEELIHFTEDPVLKINIYNGIASVLICKGEYNKSLGIIQKALFIAENIKNKKSTAKTLYVYGRALSGLNQTSLALKQYKRALGLIGQNEKILLRVKLNLYIGYLFYNRSEYTTAKAFFMDALNIALALNNEKYKAMTWRLLGNVSFSENNYSVSLDKYIKALKFYEKSPYQLILAKLLNDFGNLFVNLGNNNKALEFYLRAKDIADKKGYRSIDAMLLNNLGTIYQEMGNLDKSLEFYFKALKGEREKNNKLAITIGMYNIGSLYLEMNQLQNAENYIRESNKISNDIKDKAGIVLTNITLAKIFKQKNSFNKAIDYMKKAYNESVLIGSKDLLRNIYEEYSYLYTSLHQYEKARINSQKSEKLRKEILNEKNSKIIAEMMMRFETEKKELEIKNLKNDKMLKDLALNKKEFQKNLVLVGLLLVILIIVLLFRQFRLKISSNMLIKMKNEELKKAYYELELIAATDSLTKLANRRDVLQKMLSEMERFKRRGRAFVIIIGDIDDFKKVNDNYGHNAGDSILVSIADIFREFVREQDTVSRWGGEEFLIFLPETDLKGGVVLAEKIRKGIERNNFNYYDNILNVTLTFGVCEFGEGMDIDYCIKESDNALYKGKREGKNRVISCF